MAVNLRPMTTEIRSGADLVSVHNAQYHESNDYRELTWTGMDLDGSALAGTYLQTEHREGGEIQGIA